MFKNICHHQEVTQLTRFMHNNPEYHRDRHT